jgi:hypothetical protein
MRQFLGTEGNSREWTGEKLAIEIPINTLSLKKESRFHCVLTHTPLHHSDPLDS